MHLQTETLNRHALVQVRERAGLAQAELARRIGVDRSSLCNLEKGKRSPRPGTLLRIVKVLAAELACEVDTIRAELTTAIEAA